MFQKHILNPKPHLDWLVYLQFQVFREEPQGRYFNLFGPFNLIVWCSCRSSFLTKCWEKYLDIIQNIFCKSLQSPLRSQLFRKKLMENPIWKSGDHVHPLYLEPFYPLIRFLFNQVQKLISPFWELDRFPNADLKVRFRVRFFAYIPNLMSKFQDSGVQGAKI